MENTLYRELLITNEQGIINKEESRSLVIEIQNRWLEERNELQDKLHRRNMQIKELKVKLHQVKTTGLTCPQCKRTTYHYLDMD